MTAKPHVYAEDMPAEDVERIISVASEALNAPTQGTTAYMALASRVRAVADKEFGQGWNCVVGADFGAFLTHKSKNYVYFRVASGVNVLLWRC